MIPNIKYLQLFYSWFNMHIAKIAVDILPNVKNKFIIIRIKDYCFLRNVSAKWVGELHTTNPIPMAEDIFKSAKIK